MDGCQYMHTHAEFNFLHPNNTIFFYTEKEIQCLLSFFSLLRISLDFFEGGICKKMCKNLRFG